ncbi:MAG: hypothetical protein IKS03_03430 [Ruminococcus sp.]|nr:hypothetical protein [Ruminococcus sp.]
MKKQILIGNDKSCLGKLLSKKLMSLGYICDYTDNRCDTLRQKLNIKKYEGIFLFVPSDESGVYDFLREIKAYNKNILIITAIYGYNESLFKKLAEEGIDKCVIVSSVDDMCTAVTDVIDKNDRKCFRPEIEEFLTEMNFPRYISGFYYLCTAIEICISEQRYKKVHAMSLYNEIAEKMKVKPSCVERSLRHFSKISLYRNSVAKALGSEAMGNIRNSKLILKTTVMFAEKYGLIGKNNQNLKKII